MSKWLPFCLTASRFKVILVDDLVFGKSQRTLGSSNKYVVELYFI